MNSYLPLCVPFLDDKDASAVKCCVESTFVSSAGPLVQEFERRISDVSNYKYVTSVASGTCALELALRYFQINEDDLVLAPTYSFIATANAINNSKGTPIFFDTAKDSLNVDVHLINEYLEKFTKLSTQGGHRFHIDTGQAVRAIVIVAVNGAIPCANDLRQLKDHFGLPIILDAAACMGLNFSDFSDIYDFITISFNGNKIMTTGGGGAVLTNSTVADNWIRSVSSTARSGTSYLHEMRAFNYRMPSLNAALGLSQIDKIYHFLEKKHYIYQFYKDAFDTQKIVSIIQTPDYVTSTAWLTGITVASEHLTRVRGALRDDNIYHDSFWFPLHMQKPYASCNFIGPGRITQKWSNIQMLPSSVGLSDDDLIRVVNTIANA